MFEIKGRYGTAQCYATQIDEDAISQIREMCNQEFTEGQRIAIMPDAHPGMGCTIGTTMTITDKAVPNLVGVDIGCGMHTTELGKQKINLQSVDRACHSVPSGKNVWDKPIETFDLTELCCYSKLKNIERLERSLGTLGGGNHFIEIGKGRQGDQYLTIHSGSRNLGHQVATHYQRVAVEQHYGKGGHPQTASDTPKELCWLSGQSLKDYLHDIEVCQRWARRNRELITHQILERTNLVAGNSFHTIHNFINTDEMILRKGAISAHSGEKVLIPINMRDGSILAIGKGNPEWNYSAPHGAGRLLSRKEARQKLKMRDFKATMSDVYTTSVRKSTLDEAPMAYKPMEAIMENIDETVDVLDILTPIYSFKA